VVLRAVLRLLEAEWPGPRRGAICAPIGRLARLRKNVGSEGFLWEAVIIATRIQLGPMPTMLSEIVVQMLSGGETVIVGPSLPGIDPLDAALDAGAQLLVIQSDPGPNGTIERIFAQPGLAILMISSDGREGRLVSFAQQPVTLDRESMAALVPSFAGHA
jgi:hypothetical protein